MKNKSINQKTIWFIASLIFVIISIVLILRSPHRIHPDAICYFKNAEYFFQGDFFKGLSGHWSPFLSILLIPAYIFKMNIQILYRIYNLIIGVLGLYFLFKIIREHFSFKGFLAKYLYLLTSILFIWYANRDINPDFIVLNINIIILYLGLRSDLLKSKKSLIYLGTLAGFAYLIKFYFFPFYILIIPFFLIFNFVINRKEYSKKTISKALITSFAPFLIISVILIIPLSIKYKRVTISISTKLIKNMNSPPHIKTEDWVIMKGVWSPEPGYINIFQTPDKIKFDSEFSYFESPKSFLHIINVIAKNFRKLLIIFQHSDLLMLNFILNIMVFFLIFLIKSLDLKTKLLRLILYVFISVGGYLVTWIGLTEFRYFYIIHIISIIILLELEKHIRPKLKNKKRIIGILIIIFTFSLLFNPIQDIFINRNSLQFYSLSMKIKDDKIEISRFVSNNWFFGTFVSYYLDTPFYGNLDENNTEEVIRKMSKEHIQYYILFYDKTKEEEFRNDPRFHLKKQYHYQNVKGIPWDVTIFKRSSQ